LEAISFLGCPPTRAGDKLGRWAFEKTLEVYDVVASLYRQSEESDMSPHSETFHFAHGDLSDYNILIDPDTGAITGIIDWEMAGFRPPWLAAVGAGWFDDDSQRFLMTDDQSAHGDYIDEMPTDALVRAHFRLKLAELDKELFRHHLQGVELRALFYACCNEYAGNTEIWLGRYKNHEPTDRRGPFPFDYMAWVGERLDLEERSVSN
jgi:aminoglycoside phosphotransferase (APT) family kinase protein